MRAVDLLHIPQPNKNVLFPFDITADPFVVAYGVDGRQGHKQRLHPARPRKAYHRTHVLAKTFRRGMRQMLRVRVGRDGSPVVIDIVAAEPDQRRFSLRMGRDLPLHYNAALFTCHAESRMILGWDSERA